MPSGRMLPDHLRSELRQALVILDLSQKEWAERAEVSAALISNLIGSSQQPVRDPNRVRKLAGVLTERLDEVRQRLNAADTARVEEAIHSLLVEFGLAEQRFIAPPGGPISPQAANHIHRQAHDRAIAALGNFPFTLNIYGARGSGKSTLIAALTQEAEKMNLNPSVLDLSTISLRMIELGRQVHYLLTKAAEYLIFDWQLKNAPVIPSGNDVTDVTTENWFPMWLRTTLRSAPQARRIIIWDGLEVLAESVRIGLMEQVSTITNARSRDLSLPSFILITVEPLDVVAQSARIKVGSFTQEEVQLLGQKTLPPSQMTDAVGHRVFDAYQGQPDLTHRAFDILKASPERGIEEILKEQNPPM